MSCKLAQIVVKLHFIQHNITVLPTVKASKQHKYVLRVGARSGKKTHYVEHNTQVLKVNEGNP